MSKCDWGRVARGLKRTITHVSYVNCCCEALLVKSCTAELSGSKK
jgi:hypothetical protein